ncbi:GNAT family N-acetyltransferase [Bacillus cereus]|uniref:GNAT family N-acetyltransferase n=1 Tax=Bacillus cereus group TaxID=86661 RepID=UPI00062D7118|nr:MULTISPECIES: GNAT family N-acetyltransferase [Bacillus cereus group]KLA35437.1 hypothetical protein B4080_3350 [Bacillus cereus]MBJ8153874.1 GNAT family N-acetyltransferase [Bacillus cereus]MBJ8204395.1 GNAT family N-acetyltransferase [Bacillus cereus]MCY8952468.1 GNAT family N-acetyltransferase [Bacillus cereus]PED02707.1 GNAT family N-acetyltransferase [Bacillus cereus]
MEIRNVLESDYSSIINVLDNWWGGRKMSNMLPKLFFTHFQDTSFIVEHKGEIIGFLIGFVSQTFPEEAYIHFVGVSPKFRKQGIGKNLYEKFFEVVKMMSCNKVRCVTSPINKKSIAYHTKMKFEIQQGDKEIDGVSVYSNYDGTDGDRVLFLKQI